MLVSGRHIQCSGPIRDVPAKTDRTGATPFFPRRWGRSRPYVSLRKGSPAAPAGWTTTPGAHDRSTAQQEAAAVHARNNILPWYYILTI